MLAARTLVNLVKLKLAVRVANIGNSPYQLSSGQLVGHAMPVSVDATCAPRVAEGGTPEHVACILSTRGHACYRTSNCGGLRAEERLSLIHI